MPKPTESEIINQYDRLNKYCRRITRPRQAILDILNREGRHMSAGQVYKATSSSYPSVGLATVYRNLDLLVKTGLVWKFDAGNNRAMYEIAGRPGEGHHHHLICKKCNSVIDYSDAINNERDFIRQREKSLARRYNFRIENHCIDFFGLCGKCRKGE